MSRYAINYSPFDVVYKLCKFAPLRLMARAMDQLHVTHHIHHGVNYALKHYTAAYLIAVIVGIAKGNHSALKTLSSLPVCCWFFWCVFFT